MKTPELLVDEIAASALMTPENILFGCGRLEELHNILHGFEKCTHAMLITGANSAERSGLRSRLTSMMQAHDMRLTIASVSGEPTATVVNKIASESRGESVDIVISCGGGAVVDTGKAIAALVTNPGNVEDYLEGVGNGSEVIKVPLPHITIPTTAGTGAEMTKNAVISDYERQYKKSMRDARMIPSAVIIDPLLMTSVPSEQTAAGGMDTITQLIEPCISKKRTPETSMLAAEALAHCRDALVHCYANPAHVPAREQMACASMISGVCLANSGLAMAHGIASGMGAVKPIPHGLICGILLPHTLRYNRDACEQELATALGAFLGKNESTGSTIDEGIEVIVNLNHSLGIPESFEHLGLTEREIRLISEKSIGSSMNGNPITMDTASTYAFLGPLC